MESITDPETNGFLMNETAFKHWFDAIHSDSKRPAYLMIADLISDDIDQGRLKTNDRLPPLRDLAGILDLNYTTVSRAYKEARGRGLIHSRPGTGTFIKGKTTAIPLRGGSNVEMTMNLPPEPNIQSLLDKINHSAQTIMANYDMYSLFRYQDFGGTDEDKAAAQSWLKQLKISDPKADQILVCPGIHSALTALLSQFTAQGGLVCVENLVYPGIKAIAAQLGIKLAAIDSDTDGPLIRPLETLCQKEKIAAIYLNPTIQNPTTHTISQARREALADLALRYSIPIIEDDVYGMLPDTPLTPIAELAPEVTYYLTGFSKCFAAGLRTGYLYAPSKLLAQRASGALRALSVMASPITTAMATQWINDGTLQAMIDAVRDEGQARQLLAKQHLSHYKYYAHSSGFHLWLELPKHSGLNATNIAAHLRAQNVSVVSAAAFCTNNNPPNAIRMCLGGPISRWQCEEALQLIADILEHPAHLTSVLL